MSYKLSKGSCLVIVPSIDVWQDAEQKICSAVGTMDFGGTCTAQIFEQIGAVNMWRLLPLFWDMRAAGLCQDSGSISLESGR